MGQFYAGVDTAQGICFAIASNTVRWVAGWLIKDGRIRRSVIGVGGQTVPLLRKLVHSYRLPISTGIMVAAVEAGTPGALAGLATGDIIVEFAGEPTPSVDRLHTVLTAERIDTAVEISVLRGFELKKLSIVPREWAEAA